MPSLRARLLTFGMEIFSETYRFNSEIPEIGDGEAAATPGGGNTGVYLEEVVEKMLQDGRAEAQDLSAAGEEAQPTSAGRGPATTGETGCNETTTDGMRFRPVHLAPHTASRSRNRRRHGSCRTLRSLQSVIKVMG
ncbi:hypothetical protein HPB47_019678 [Ixodes persulcatus]|uniref:Uncharacterized protein n=1 Tax=Ixodes persulcatus TaxID=34615 RepID=A0AC60QHG4_IXOPE|nr:hypothetical protein HPB47_019678 [Ixodes persulcatus]